MNKVFIDLDGVLFDFEARACELLGLDIYDEKVRKSLKSNSPDESLDKLVGRGKFWSTISRAGEDYWAGLELFPWAKQLYTDMMMLAEDNVYFLTSPSSDPHSLSGKHKAIRKHFNNTRNFLIGTPKHCCARKDHLLIDDTPKKVNKFREHDGKAYLFPHAYRIIDGELTYEDVLESIYREIQ